jgi:anti-sigma B factor antagonist
MKFTIENDDNIIVFSIKEKTIGAELAPDLKAKILIEAQPNIKGMIFELTNVESMDSSGLGSLLLANRQLRDYSVPVYIVQANSFVKNLMAMTKIDQLFEFFETIEDAKQKVLLTNSEN